MMIRDKHQRKYLRRWCALRGVEFNRKVWLVRKHLCIRVADLVKAYP